MMRRLLPVVVVLAAGPAATAHAQDPAPTTPTQPPKLGLVSLRTASGLSDRGEQYVMKRQRVEVRGAVRRFSEGQVAVVDIYRSKRRTSRVRARVRKARGGGAFSMHFTARRGATYTVRARVLNPDGAMSARSKRRLAVRSINPQAGSGSSGVRVRLLQRGLRRLGFVSSMGGSFDHATARAVLAFRKTNGMHRVGFASREVYSLLFRGRGAFKLRFPKAGKHVEFDWSRQVLVLARNGRPERVYHTSSGTPSTPTVFGTFRFYRKQPGTNAKGMVFSNYFIRGYAIHGYHSVPPFPASHGCLRVPIPNAVSIYRWVNLGDRIFAYR